MRLCKGAYREPSDLAFPRKSDVDRNYARLAGMLFSKEAQAAGAYAAFATHDERLIRVIADRAREFGLAPDRYEFQMLHGIRPELHRTLIDLGVRSACSCHSARTGTGTSCGGSPSVRQTSAVLP